MQGLAYLHFAVDSITTTDSSSRAGTVIVAPAGSLLTIGTISRHMTCVTTDSANDAGGVVLSLRAVVLAVSNLSAVLTSLVLVVSKSTVECGELTKLVTL